MSKRRDWDKVRDETKVQRKGTLPVTDQNWQSDMEMQQTYKGELTYEDLKMIALAGLKHVVFKCRNRRCKPQSDLASFLQLNGISHATPVIEREFASIQMLVNEDVDRLAKSVALSNPQGVNDGTFNYQREFINLLIALRKQGKQLNSILENL